jgi:isoleucyl-tRNA synthetase
MELYPEIKTPNIPAIEKEIIEFWESEKIFERSTAERPDAPAFTFYEGPPSANGLPGIHHVLSRTLKDVFCRYKTLKGYRVARKAGWDTHGLPVELQVEKELGITKKDVGVSISVQEYNRKCREAVMRFKDVWDRLTIRMGYWLDLENPYVTFENEYIESVWHLLKRLFDRGLLYKGYTIQPYSPAAGTGLSSHELNLPGCYKPVKDTSVVAQFKATGRPAGMDNVYFLAWTTTPWTLPANAALAVGENIDYSFVETYNPYTYLRVKVVLAQALLHRYFPPENERLDFTAFQPGDKKIPFRILTTVKGSELVGERYEQLMPYIRPEGDAFRVIAGDFVSTDDGTGIVHIAPTFGSDDFRVAAKNNIPAIVVKRKIETENGNPSLCQREEEIQPIVDREGKYVPEIVDFAGRYVKNYTDDPNFVSLDVDIAVKLKQENKAFRVEKYEHNYPHCWRTDKPVLYYPLDSWFIKTSAFRERMVEINKTIQWKPESTGTGRFGNWLENVNDWNLSRSRFWGIPLPIWANDAGNQFKCIGSIEELAREIEYAVQHGFTDQPYTPEQLRTGKFDLHKPYIDRVILYDPECGAMRRQPDLIDVWFDSGAMPFAQHHYPFENREVFAQSFPADFIAEGVDQTRGWFYTLHAIAVLLEDKPAYKNVIANGLVLDKDGRKMSKRLGNAVEPFAVMEEWGADVLRWYMLENVSPWENLRFNMDGLVETYRKFFVTLYNTYGFFALYANIDHFTYNNAEVTPVAERPPMDRWIVSRLQSLIAYTEKEYENYEPTRVARAIQHFVVEELSNWYVRLNRRRFWKGEMNQDKKAAYQTLYECLTTIAKLMSPIAPFSSEKIYRCLTGPMRGANRKFPTSSVYDSVHLSSFPVPEPRWIDPELDYRMEKAQAICSLGRSIRRKHNIKVRIPLKKAMLPALDAQEAQAILAEKELIMSELNVKDVEIIPPGFLVKKAKPNFRLLGKKLGPKMKSVQTALENLSSEAIAAYERDGQLTLELLDGPVVLSGDEIELTTLEVPGLDVAGDGKTTVALDIVVTDELRLEGTARELVNRIQNRRKDLDFEVTDKIKVVLSENTAWNLAVQAHKEFIAAETLAVSLEIGDVSDGTEIEIDEARGLLHVERV